MDGGSFDPSTLSDMFTFSFQVPFESQPFCFHSSNPSSEAAEMRRESAKKLSLYDRFMIKQSITLNMRTFLLLNK